MINSHILTRIQNERQEDGPYKEDPVAEQDSQLGGTKGQVYKNGGHPQLPVGNHGRDKLELQALNYL
jgi:hypothetical protein